LEVNRQVTAREIENNLENGEEYAKLTKTPYQNLMLKMGVLRIEKRPTWHKSFLPQEVVKCEVWNNGL
jgi:hypothetical protein